MHSLFHAPFLDTLYSAYHSVNIRLEAEQEEGEGEEGEGGEGEAAEGGEEKKDEE